MRRLPKIFRILLTLLLFLSAHGVLAEQVIQEEFEGSFLHEQGVAVGMSGQGWTQPATGENIRWPVSFTDAQVGMISFDIQRRMVSPTRDVDTVFDLLDENGFRVLRMQVSWASPAGGTALYLNSLPSREYYQYGIQLWAPALYLDREVDPGDWIHVDLVWDDVSGEYQAFVDETPLKAELENVELRPGQIEVPNPRLYVNEEARKRGEPLPYPEKPVQFFLQRVTDIAVGSYPIPNQPEGRARTLLSNSVVDNFEVRLGSLATIQLVTHDAFAKAGYSGKLVAGDTVTVTLNAEPGGTATFDIVRPASEVEGRTDPLGVEVTDVLLTEDVAIPGTYKGDYGVEPGIFVEDGQVIGRFTNGLGFNASPVAAGNPINIDSTVHLAVNPGSDLVPADETARSGLTVVATDANGKPVKGHDLKLTLSTTDEYTGTVGGGTFKDNVGGSIDVAWGGVTDSFGEVTAQYISGFAAKTILVSARDMVSGDVGVGWVRSYIEGEVDILVTEPKASALSVAGSMDVSLSRDWLTADGQSRSRINAIVKDAGGDPVSGHSVQFTLLGDNGSIRIIQGKTDSRGRAIADYIAGTVMGQVQVEVRDLTSGMVVVVPIELRPDAPAEIILVSDESTVVTGGQSTITATVKDINGNPNSNVDVLYDIAVGTGAVEFPSVATDEDGVAAVVFTADKSGPVTISGTVISREPTVEEISAAEGAIFLYGLEDDPGRLEIIEWLVKAGDEVVEGQDLVVLEDRSDISYTVVAPRDGTVSTFVAEERDRVEYGDTLGYIIEVAE